MHKTLILFFSFFLLASCGSSEYISQEHRTTSITPIAHIDTNNPEGIGGIQFEITTSLEKNENIASIISWSHEENEDFLRSHKEKILENFEEFTHNPTTEYSTKNVAVITSAHYHLLKAPYFSEEWEGLLGTGMKKLMLGIIQNYNQYYTGSLWDLPIASLYCDTCQTIGIPIRDIILATKTQDSPEGFLQISKEVSRNGEFPSIGRIMSIDNTYQEVPENIIYHLWGVSDIFDIIEQYPNAANFFRIHIHLPDSHKISDIFYEYQDTIMSLENIFSENTIEITKIPEILHNKQGKITISITQKK